MDAWIIILGVIIVFIIYFLIRYYFYSSTALADKVYLKSPPADISLNTSLNPSSILYTFGSWVYVNNFSNCVLFSYVNPVLAYTHFALILGGIPGTSVGPGDIKGTGSPNKPVLTAVVNGNIMNSQIGRPSYNQITITNNFPIQKWVYVTVSVDTIYADCYIDGKLVISYPLKSQITTAPVNQPVLRFTQPTNVGAANNIVLAPPDIYLTKVTRWPKQLSPTDVWGQYSAGNGLSQGGNFSVALDVTSDTGSNNYTIYSNSY